MVGQGFVFWVVTRNLGLKMVEEWADRYKPNKIAQRLLLHKPKPINSSEYTQMADSWTDGQYSPTIRSLHASCAHTHMRITPTHLSTYVYTAEYPF